MLKKKGRFLAVFLAVVMVVSVFAPPALAAPVLQGEYSDRNIEDQGVSLQESLELTLAQDEFLPASTLSEFGGERMADEQMNFLRLTMDQDAVGVFGFYGNYELPTNLETMVDIVVQFRTPPAVAQRLIAEANNNAAALPGIRNAEQTIDFEQSAQLAHTSFGNQFQALVATLPVPFGLDAGASADALIFSYHSTLFNGVFMTVPAGLVGAIAELEEVFSVTPAMIPHTLENLSAMGEGIQIPQTSASEGAFDSDTLLGMLVGQILVVPEDFQQYNYVWHPEFNQGAREMFDLDYINYELGYTGAGIRVGIIDTGIDYRHPAFWHMLIPVADGAGFVRDEDGQYWSLPGGNFMTAPVSGRGVGRGTSGMEMVHGPNHSTHGTHVAGIALGMAPDITFYSLRILAAEPGGGALSEAPLLAIEYAYYLGLDVVNNSWAYVGNTNHPWYAFTYATNVAALAGIISTNATGNDGLGGATPTADVGGWFSLNGGGATASLGISVASGQGGNRHLLGMPNATINGELAPTLVVSGVPADFNITDLPYGDLSYTWFGRLTVPNRAFFNNEANATAWLTDFRNEFLDGGNLEGQVAVFNRGGGELLSYHFIAYRLGAVANIVTNNAAGPITGTTHNSPNPADPPLVIPNFSMPLDESTAHFGDPLPVPIPPLTGTINFGGIALTPSPDLKTPSSSIGPLGPVGIPGFDGGIGYDGELMQAIMHVFPSITAPGANIVSTFTITHANRITGRPYHAQGGTSMAGPAIAGIAALLLEQSDGPLAESTRPGTRAVEVQARIMQNARPLVDYTGNYSVNQVGAGVVNPLASLRNEAFATTVHSIPFALHESVEDPGDIPYQQIPFAWRTFEDHTMASLSFGRVTMEEDEPGESAVLPITIHGTGAWELDRLVFNEPTQELRNPDTGAWGGNWGPRLQFADLESVEYNITSTGANAYEIYFTHDGNLDNRGFVEGHIFFTDGNGGELFMIFGVYFDVEYEPPPAELLPRSGTGIWRPIISGFVSPNHGDYDDPREFPGGWLANPGIHIMTARSNFSPVTVGFNDASGTARNVRVYVGPYGSELGDEDVRLHTTLANLPANSYFFVGNLLRPIVGGSLFNITGQPTWQASDGFILEQGVYTLFKVVVNPGGDDLIEEHTFVVTTERPTIEFDEETFYFNQGDEYVAVTGRVNSFGHDMALYHGIGGMTAWDGGIDLFPGANYGPFTYANSWLRFVPVPAIEFPVAADGTFRITVGLEPDDYGRFYFPLLFSDSDGQSVVPAVAGGGWNSVSWGASNRSLITPFVLEGVIEGADFTALDEALASAATITSDAAFIWEFTAESREALTDAVDAANALVRDDINANQQYVVDALTNAINEAIAGLVQAPRTTVLRGTSGVVLTNALNNPDIDYVVISVPGNLGLSNRTIPAGTTLVVANRVHVGANLVVEGSVLVPEGGQLHIQQNGSMTIALGGSLVNNGVVHVNNHTQISVYGSVINHARFDANNNNGDTAVISMFGSYSVVSGITSNRFVFEITLG